MKILVAYRRKCVSQRKAPAATCEGYQVYLGFREGKRDVRLGSLFFGHFFNLARLGSRGD